MIGWLILGLASGSVFFGFLLLAFTPLGFILFIVFLGLICWVLDMIEEPIDLPKKTADDYRPSITPNNDEMEIKPEPLRPPHSTHISVPGPGTQKKKYSRKIPVIGKDGEKD